VILVSFSTISFAIGTLKLHYSRVPAAKLKLLKWDHDFQPFSTDECDIEETILCNACYEGVMQEKKLPINSLAADLDYGNTDRIFLPFQTYTRRGACHSVGPTFYRYYQVDWLSTCQTTMW
jgi:hypothetical protein